MDVIRYEVVVRGIRPEVEPQTVREGMAALTGGDPAGFDGFVERAMSGEGLLVKDGLDREQAQEYLQALERVGLVCQQRMMVDLLPTEAPQAPDSYNCPACGALQPLAQEGPDICGKCGVVRQRYEETLAQRRLLEREHRKFRQGLEWEAHKEREEKERELQRRQEQAIQRMLKKMYGVDSLSRWRATLLSRRGAVAAGILVLGVGGAVGAWLLSRQYFQEPEAPVAVAGSDPAGPVPQGPAIGAGQGSISPEALARIASSLPTEAVGTGTGQPPVSDGSPVQAGGSGAGPAPEEGTPVAASQGPSPVPADRPAGVTASQDEAGPLSPIGQTLSTEPGPPPPPDPRELADGRAAVILASVALNQAQAGNLDESSQALIRAGQRLEVIGHAALHQEVDRKVAFYRAQALAELGRRQALAGDIPTAQGSFLAALEIINHLEPAAQQAAAYGFIARCLVEGGDELTGEEYFQQALTVADQAIEPLERMGALVAVADQARLAARPTLATQAVSRAEEVLGELDQPLDQALGLGLLARYRAARLDGEIQPLFAEAAAAAQAVEDPDQRRQMMARLFAFQAEALATAVRQRRPGQEKQALRAAAAAWQRAFEVDDPQLRALALSQVALGFALAGDRERSRQVFGQALEGVPEV